MFLNEKPFRERRIVSDGRPCKHERDASPTIVIAESCDVAATMPIEGMFQKGMSNLQEARSQVRRLGSRTCSAVIRSGSLVGHVELDHDAVLAGVNIDLSELAQNDTRVPLDRILEVLDADSDWRQELGSRPAVVEAIRRADAAVLLPGHFSGFHLESLLSASPLHSVLVLDAEALQQAGKTNWRRVLPSVQVVVLTAEAVRLLSPTSDANAGIRKISNWLAGGTVVTVGSDRLTYRVRGETTAIPMVEKGIVNRAILGRIGATIAVAMARGLQAEQFARAAVATAADCRIRDLGEAVSTGTMHADRGFATSPRPKLALVKRAFNLLASLLASGIAAVLGGVF